MKINRSNLVLAAFSTLVAGLVLSIYFFYEVNPIFLNIFGLIVAISSWIIALRLTRATFSYIVLVLTWLVLAGQYYYLGYSGIDIATSMGQQSENIQMFNFVVIPLAIVFTLTFALVKNREAQS